MVLNAFKSEIFPLHQVKVQVFKYRSFRLPIALAQVHILHISKLTNLDTSN